MQMWSGWLLQLPIQSRGNTITKGIEYTPIWGIESHVLQFNGRLSAPLTLSLEITNVCNQNCLFCIQPEKWGTGTFEKYHTSMEDVEKLLHEAKMLGVLEFHISGGEPTCHPRFIQIVDLIKKLRFRTSIITNGIDFSSDDVKKLRHILDPEQDLLLLGLDTADPETYRKLRGKRQLGSLCKTMEMLRDAGLPFATQTVIVNDNIAFLEDVWRLSSEYGAKAHVLILPYRKKKIAEDIYPPDQEIGLALARLSERGMRPDMNGTQLIFPGGPGKEHRVEHVRRPGVTAARPGCPSGHTSCAANSRGDVHICDFALDCGLSVGNLYRTSLHDCWKNIRHFMERTFGASPTGGNSGCPFEGDITI